MTRPTRKRNHRRRRPAEQSRTCDSDLSLDFLRVVEQAAIACAHTMGQGDRHKSDQVAVEAMRHEMDSVPIDGTIVIGEGERDEAPMLYIGEKVGIGAQGDGAGYVPAGRHRGRSARRHEPLRHRRAERAGRARGVRERAGCCTRPTSTWRSWSSARARATWSISTRRSGSTCGRSPSRSAARSRISWSSCSTARATRS